RNPAMPLPTPAVRNSPGLVSDHLPAAFDSGLSWIPSVMPWSAIRPRTRLPHFSASSTAHAWTEGLPALQLAMARLGKAALDVDAAGPEVGSCSVTVPPITRGKRLGEILLHQKIQLFQL